MRSNWGRLLLDLSLIIGIALGFIALLYQSTVSSVTVGADFRAYNTAAESVLSGGPLYGTSPTGLKAHSFLYFPLVIIPFILSAPLPGWFPAYVLFTAFKIALLLWFGVLLLSRLRTHGLATENRYTVLLPGYVLLSVHSLPNLFIGQVNALLGALVGIGLLQFTNRQDRRAGVNHAIAAVVKPYIAAIGVLYLRYRRAAAVKAAIATGLVVIASSIVLFGIETHEVFISQLLSRGAATPTLSNSLWGFERVGGTLFSPGSTLQTAFSISVAALLVVAGTIVSDKSAPDWRFIFIVVSAILLAVPSYIIYFPLVYAPLLMAAFMTRYRTAFAVGFFIAQFAFSYPNVIAVAHILGTEDIMRPLGSLLFRIATPLTIGLTLCIFVCLYEMYDKQNQ